MSIIKINFVDFWPQLDKNNNYFFNLLSRNFDVKLDELNPELIFFSVFGEDNLKYSCRKIFYTGENIEPNFKICDFAFSYSHKFNKKHFRLPLYSIYHEYFFNRGKILNSNNLAKAWEEKSKFCCMVVSNPRSQKRIDFFKTLSSHLHVDSGGSVLNNVGGRVPDKLDFINNYKFVLSFENEMGLGYTTEKILEPILSNCIPIYWGNELIHKDFNKERFINYHDFDSEEDLIERIIEINSNPKLAIEMINQPMLSKNRVSFEEEKEQVLEQILLVINSKKKPIAQTLLGTISNYRVRYSNGRIFKYVKYKLLNFLK